MSAADWIAIIGAIGALCGTIAASAIAVIKALKASNVEAAKRHEEIIARLPDESKGPMYTA